MPARMRSRTPALPHSCTCHAVSVSNITDTDLLKPQRTTRPPAIDAERAGNVGGWLGQSPIGLRSAVHSACSSNSPGQFVSARETLPSKSALNFSRMSAFTFRYSLSFRTCAVVMSTGSRMLIDTP